MTGKLYLVPVPIAEGGTTKVIPVGVIDILKQLRYFLAEDARSARRYFSSLKIFDSIETLNFNVLDKDTSDAELPTLLNPLLTGFDMGLVSESGCPGVADPGSKAVLWAHQKEVSVVPLVGPSSILLALMASGLNGQQFGFHGYLPIDVNEVSKKIKELERESREKGQTQIFIETPYRNNSLFDQLLKNLSNSAWLSVATDLTGTEERVLTRTVTEWKRSKPVFSKAPTVFSFLAT